LLREKAESNDSHLRSADHKGKNFWKEINMKKQALFGILGAAITISACSISSVITPITPTPVDQVGTVVAATIQAYTALPGTQPTTSGNNIPPISLHRVSIAVPTGLASSANSETVPAVREGAGGPWEVAPEHVKFTLPGYQLQNKFHEPGIYVYPVTEYAQENSSAAEQIDRLKKILAGGALLKETLPNVPFFNAAPLMAANIKLIGFQGGSGIRELTQYDQYLAPINNHELFYHFQGLTSDGKYYVIAILPINAPILPEDEKPESPVPSGGIPIPTDTGPNDVYYIAVTQKLNALAPDNYTPSLDALDALIQSLLVTTS
jgi:hypothetical protein